MTYTRAEAFATEEQELARFAKVLSHPARIAIVRLLAEKQTCISGDIASELPLSRTTVSQHLQELKSIGLIKGEIDGLTVCYCLDHDLLQKMKAAFDSFFQEAGRNINNCC